MSKTTEYMDEVKRRQGLTSNYQLSKSLEISEADISDCYKRGKHADIYIGTRLALALGMEPIHLLAEVKAETEKNATKRGFWSSFLTRAAVVFASVLALLLGSVSINEADASTARSGKYDVGFTKAEIMRL